MELLRISLSRFAALFNKRKLDDDLDNELRFHIELSTEENLKRGMTEQEARTAALRSLGGLTQTKERYRMQRGIPFLEKLHQDIRYAFRQFGNAPGFAITAVLTLALGIGANTGMFSLLNAVLLKSLPIPHPEQLFVVKLDNRSAETSHFSYPLYQRLASAVPPSAEITAMSWTKTLYINDGTEAPSTATGQLVSGNYFQVFGTYPLLGRLFTIEDSSKVGGSPVAVISSSYWRMHFLSSRDVIGRSIDVNNVPFTIVGVSAPGFFGAREGTRPDIWVPATMQADIHYHNHYSDDSHADSSQPWVPQEQIEWLELMMRVTNRDETAQISAVLNQQYGETLKLLALDESDPREREAILQRHLELEAGQQGFATLKKDFAQPLLILMAMAAMILLIACANIANLLLARAASRERATAVQLALGASRGRLLQQTLTECLLLSLLGGTLGVGVAYWCTTVLPKWASQGPTAIPLNTRPDAAVLIFSVVVAITTGLLFGLAPAISSSRIDPGTVLKASGRSMSAADGGGRWSARKFLVSCQVCLSLVLLVGAGLFLRTLTNYSRLDPGFDRSHLLSVRIDASFLSYTPEQLLPLYEQLTAQLDSAPGVRSSSVSTCALASGCLDSSDMLVSDQEGNRAQKIFAQISSVSMSYFKTIGVPLLQGRLFTTTDTSTAPRVAVVNDTLARHTFADGSAVGHYLTFADNQTQIQIVGVVADARVNDIRQVAPPLIYFPITQQAGTVENIDVRTAGDPQAIEAQVRQAINTVDGRIPITKITTLSEQVDANLTQQRMIARLTIMFGALALGLACLGLYGVMSYTVQQKTGEIGLRLALGSTRSAVLWIVVKEILVLVTVGAAAGLVLAAICMQLVKGFIFGLSPEDPLTMALAASLLFAVSIAAGIVPASRAAWTNPTEALRTE